MTFSEEELVQEGFTPTVPQLPHVIRTYEKKLPTGNLLVFTNAGKEKPFHSLTEFLAGSPPRPAAHYRLVESTDLHKVSTGALVPFYKFK